MDDASGRVAEHLNFDVMRTNNLPLEVQLAAPLAPVYATIVCAIFFLVPVSLKGAFRSS